MANRQTGTPFSISSLMKSCDTGGLTPQMMVPPCFLDGSLASMLSADFRGSPEMPNCQSRSLSPIEGRAALDNAGSPIPHDVSLTPDFQRTLTKLTDQEFQSAHPGHPSTLMGFSHENLPSVPERPLTPETPPTNNDVSHKDSMSMSNLQTCREEGVTSSNAPYPKTKAPEDQEIVLTPRCSSSDSKGNKRNRASYSPDQLTRLDHVFKVTPYPDIQMYEALSNELDIPQKNLKTWFQNKRARSKRQSVSADKSKEVKKGMTPIVSPYPHPMSSAAAQYPYVMPGFRLPPPRTTTPPNSALITPPPSPSPPHQMVKQPIPLYPTSVLPQPPRPILSPPTGQTLAHDARAPHLLGQLSPPMTGADASWQGLPANHMPYYPGLYHDRLSLAEFRDLHDATSIESYVPQYPSMLSAIEKLCSSLPF